MSSLLSSPQKRLLSATITYATAIILIGLITLTIYFLGEILITFDKVVWPIVIAAILALLLRPVISYSQRQFKLSPASSVLLLYTILITIGSIATIKLFPFIIDQTVEAMEILPGVITNVFSYLKTQFPALFTLLQEHIGMETFWENSDLIVNAIKKSLPTVRELGSDFATFISWVTALAVIPLYLFYLLNSKSSFLQRLEHEIQFIKAKWRDDFIYLIKEYVHIMVAFFRGQLLIALIMGILFATGFSLISLKFGVVVGLALGLLNIVPYLGTIIGLLSVLPISYFQTNGGWSLLALSLTIFIVVQLIESYLLTPKIMGKQTGLHPMIIIISVFFWGIAFGGIMGMILAIPLTASLIVTWHLVKKNYLT